MLIKKKMYYWYIKISALFVRRIFSGAYTYSYQKKSNSIIDDFHKFYYNSQVWHDTSWMGILTEKCPLDLWIYQEIIYQLRPDYIVETGTAIGGSALFLANICDLINNGQIITIDIKDTAGRPKHERIKYIIGSSTSQEIVEKVQSIVDGSNRIMVILDSDHSKEHVLNEMRIYSKFVTKGCYLIVEDTNINVHPMSFDHGPGPMEAIVDFLDETRDFISDKSREKFYLTFNPNGFLRKIK